MLKRAKTFLNRFKSKFNPFTGLGAAIQGYKRWRGKRPPKIPPREKKR